MLGELPKDIPHHRTRVWPCQSVPELEPSRGTVVMGMHRDRLVVPEKWRHLL